MGSSILSKMWKPDSMMPLSFVPLRSSEMPLFLLWMKNSENGKRNMKSKEILWRKIVGNLQKCKCKCPMNEKGFCYNKVLYEQFLDFEPKGIVTCCRWEITEQGIMSVDIAI